MKRLIRASAVLCAGLLTVTTVAGTASAATPEGDAAGWLADQPTKGLVYNKQYKFDDYSLSADIARALTAIGAKPRTVKAIRTALAHNVENWTAGAEGSTDVYAGQVAKAIVLAQETGAKPRAFGGVNLVSRLEGRVATTGATAGRISDKSDYDDYANVIGQALAAQALSNAKSPLADEATSFLLQQQCAKGYFRLYFADPAAADQSCDGGARAGAVADPDATAMAVLSLQAIEKPTRTVRASIKHGVRWLKAQQRADGSFGGGVSTKGANANSTGLAATALGQAGLCGAAAEAAGWLQRLQVVQADASGTRLARHDGAIAYNRKALKDGLEHGIDKGTAYQWQMATVQAAPALKYLSKSAC
ncbi:hypothetical protein GON03_04940 [Nocardioides sp. MAH-18]|uniref:Terpene cyclase/mutase family protein n=1 Tax=Nocardioides agri TaxID=2682843 RepID=A0A6L6XPJ7_9ACTN|nr:MULTISPECIES: hypothetical protein [unclassified Nocardioides]MBA2953652.1 hypothetical protein [Nocardioides sp. CGMCC 1.13656]MVQ48516.1 hypothetical protein [Nocardioides sp. MAH-18]